MTLDHQDQINKHLTAHANNLREKLDDALAVLRPSWRLCLHPPATTGPFLTSLPDDAEFRITQTYHYLDADSTCDEPNRTEYRRD